MMGWCYPPPPSPLPLPSKARIFGAIYPCRGWGRAGVRAGLVLGMIAPPPTPLPLAPFFRGGTTGRGVKGGPRSSPPPPPPLHPRFQPLLARLWFLGWRGRGGGGVQGTNAHLATHSLNLNKPSPVPLAGLLLIRNQVEKCAASSTDGGRGLGGLATPHPNPTQPSPHRRTPPPRMWGRTISAYLGGRWVVLGRAAAF